MDYCKPDMVTKFLDHPVMEMYKWTVKYMRNVNRTDGSGPFVNGQSNMCRYYQQIGFEKKKKRKKTLHIQNLMKDG